MWLRRKFVLPFVLCTVTTGSMQYSPSWEADSCSVAENISGLWCKGCLIRWSNPCHSCPIYLSYILICVIRTNKLHFSLLIYFNNHPLHVLNRVTIHHQEVVTVYITYGIYHAENILKLCKITYINIVIKSIKYCILYKLSDYFKIFFG